MKILLVEPDFPIPTKSKNHKNFLPIGLLKIHEYYKSIGHKPKLVRGKKSKREIGTTFKPDKILITSLFTYWSSYVWEAVEFYRNNYPEAEITIGGIYASLLGDRLSFKDKLKKYNAKVHFGIHKKAEKFANNNILNYSALSNPHPIDYQIIHASRGCQRHCDFCGTWKIEPDFLPKKSIKDEITKKKIVFYDNNLLKNRYIEDVLNELIELKEKRKISWCESQSGFDGRVLIKQPHLAGLLKQAGFRYPRIAWDWEINGYVKIKKQIDILVNGGYNYRDIFVFMIYNWDIPFEEMEEKRIKCWKWEVQISDCRFRPLDQTFDNYNPHLKREQTSEEYYIHEKYWTDQLVKQFRKNVRRQNICLRQRVSFYSTIFEHMRADKDVISKTKIMSRDEVEDYLKKLNIEYWFPEEITYPENSKIVVGIKS